MFYTVLDIQYIRVKMFSCVSHVFPRFKNGKFKKSTCKRESHRENQRIKVSTSLVNTNI